MNMELNDDVMAVKELAHFKEAGALVSSRYAQTHAHTHIHTLTCIVLCCCSTPF